MKILLIFLAILLVAIVVVYIQRYRLFIHLLRKDKGTGHKKDPKNIEEIKNNLIIIHDQVYPSTYKKNTYDLYLPKDKKNVPVIIWVHGGSFIAGDKEGTRNFGPLMASQGYAFISINYEWAPEQKFPHQIIQLSQFITYLVDELSSLYPIDIQSLILGGDSAGANIVASYIAITNHPSLQAQLPTIPYYPIKASLLFCGPYKLDLNIENIEDKRLRFYFETIGWAYSHKKRWWKTDFPKLSSPMYWMNDKFVPTYITDGSDFSFEEHAKKMVSLLEENEVYVKSRFFEKRLPHEFQFNYTKYAEESYQVYEDCLSFLRSVLNEK